MRGVQYLQPALAEPGRWDVLVGHYLGVDHAGHTADVNSPAMAAKLTQMESEVAQVGARRTAAQFSLLPLRLQKTCCPAHWYESMRKVEWVAFSAPSHVSGQRKCNSLIPRE